MSDSIRAKFISDYKRILMQGTGPISQRFRAEAGLPPLLTTESVDSGPGLPPSLERSKAYCPYQRAEAEGPPSLIDVSDDDSDSDF